MTTGQKAKHITLIVLGVLIAAGGVLAQGVSGGLHLSTWGTLGSTLAIAIAAFSRLDGVFSPDPKATSEVKSLLSILGSIASVSYGVINGIYGTFAPGSSVAIVAGILLCITGDLRAFAAPPIVLPKAAAILLLLGSFLFASPAHAQTPSQFGGCFMNGEICLGPSASIMIGEYNFTTGKFLGGVIPGVGYGATLTPSSATWATVGLDFYAAFAVSQSGGVPNSFTPMFVGSFANYVRIGFGLPITEQASGPALTQKIITFGLGSNFGGSTNYVAKQSAAKDTPNGT